MYVPIFLSMLWIRFRVLRKARELDWRESAKVIESTHRSYSEHTDACQTHQPVVGSSPFVDYAVDPRNVLWEDTADWTRRDVLDFEVSARAFASAVSSTWQWFPSRSCRTHQSVAGSSPFVVYAVNLINVLWEDTVHRMRRDVGDLEASARACRFNH